eukprot:408233-Pyramimonas_sp.AAC.5
MSHEARLPRGAADRVAKAVCAAHRQHRWRPHLPLGQLRRVHQAVFDAGGARVAQHAARDDPRVVLHLQVVHPRARRRVRDQHGAVHLPHRPKASFQRKPKNKRLWRSRCLPDKQRVGNRPGKTRDDLKQSTTHAIAFLGYRHRLGYATLVDIIISHLPALHQTPAVTCRTISTGSFAPV